MYHNSMNVKPLTLGNICISVEAGNIVVRSAGAEPVPQGSPVSPAKVVPASIELNAAGKRFVDAATEAAGDHNYGAWSKQVRRAFYRHRSLNARVTRNFEADKKDYTYGRRNALAAGAVTSQKLGGQEYLKLAVA